MIFNLKKYSNAACANLLTNQFLYTDMFYDELLRSSYWQIRKTQKHANNGYSMNSLNNEYTSSSSSAFVRVILWFFIKYAAELRFPP